VTFDANENLYGTTLTGGAADGGTVWTFQAGAVPQPSSLVSSLTGLVLAGGGVRLKHHHRSEDVSDRAGCFGHLVDADLAGWW
jgi:uncharacterized repeat protein (TIGR03803 family)